MSYALLFKHFREKICRLIEKEKKKKKKENWKKREA